MIFKIFIIGHLLGDFYLQNDKIAEKKKQKFQMLFVHCFLYFLSILFVSLVIIPIRQWGMLCVASLCISITHGIVDYIKGKTEYNNSVCREKKHMMFLADQIVHILILYIAAKLFPLYISDGGIAFGFYSKESVERILLPLISVLVCWKPASVFIVVIFRMLSSPIAEENSCKNNLLRKEEGKTEVRIGSWIGILEREIILLLGLMNQFGAIGFVLTAKSLARYKQLENQEFAEKYLVGTLMSSMISLCCVAICKSSI